VSEPVDLGFLRHHWDGAYRIYRSAGRFRAARRDDGTIISADTVEELLEAIRADYARKPIPRKDTP
jgi:hypothetical protein